jgi:hypothetical protein
VCRDFNQGSWVTLHSKLPFHRRSPATNSLQKGRSERVGSSALALCGHRIFRGRRFLCWPGVPEFLREEMHLRVIGEHCYRVKFVSFITRVDANVKVPDLLIAARGTNRSFGVDSVSAIMLSCVLLEFRRRWRGAFLPWPACV